MVGVEERVEPEFPVGAVLSSAVRCEVEVHVSPRGVPLEIQVTECAEPFASSALAAVEQWRWLDAPHEPASGYEARARVTFQPR